MKRSFYEMLGVPHDADKAQIDAAYAQATAKLESSTNLRGATDAVTEMNLIREGYRILSDPAQRARYDGKLAADASGIKLIFFPEDKSSQRRLGLETVIFAALTGVFGAIVYWQLTRKTEELHIENVQAVAKQKDQKARPAAAEKAQPDAATTKAAEPQQKR